MADARVQRVCSVDWARRDASHKAETVIGGWVPDFMDADNWSYFVTGFVNPRLHWEDPAAKEIVGKALKTSSADERTKLYQQYYRLLAAPGSPYVGLVQGDIRYVTRSNIASFNYHPQHYFEVDQVTRK